MNFSKFELIFATRLMAGGVREAGSADLAANLRQSFVVIVRSIDFGSKSRKYAVNKDFILCKP